MPHSRWQNQNTPEDQCKPYVGNLSTWPTKLTEQCGSTTVLNMLFGNLEVEERMIRRGYS